MERPRTAKWVVVTIAVLAAAVPIGAVSAYTVGTHSAPAAGGRSVILDENVTLNGTVLGPTSNATVIGEGTSDPVSSFAVSFSSLYAADFCVSTEALASETGDFGACTEYGTVAKGLSAGAISVDTIYDYALFGVYITSGHAALVAFTWWINWTSGPVAGGAGSLFVPAGQGASVGEVSVVVQGSPHAVAIYLNASAPVRMVATGSFCCQRSLGPAVTSWEWVGGINGAGLGTIQVAWSEATAVAVSVEVVAFY